jgi:hypothetical protein
VPCSLEKEFFDVYCEAAVYEPLKKPTAISDDSISYLISEDARVINVPS